LRFDIIVTSSESLEAVKSGIYTTFVVKLACTPGQRSFERASDVGMTRIGGEVMCNFCGCWCENSYIGSVCRYKGHQACMQLLSFIEPFAIMPNQIFDYISESRASRPRLRRRILRREGEETAAYLMEEENPIPWHWL